MSFNLKNIPSQKGKIAIVTGANNGIGLETTTGLAKTGCKVIMACRSEQRGNQAKKDILGLVPDAQLDLIPLDLSDFDSVHMFAKQLKE